MIFLALSGFFPESNPHDSLQYDKDVPQTSEQAVLDVMGWKSLKDVPMGEHDLTQTQAREIMQIVKTPFRDDLIYCIGLCRED
ncbi:pyocin S6 family toxin immunity protein [Pseudomonas iridis]|uniref:Pyocin S6 family toxin immunity protein n=1 Tax=Pseudomonas iridis TaxID=2710587 RepID=A0ABW8DQK5_9PSED